MPKVAVPLPCCAHKTSASVIHSLEVGPEDTGGSGSLAPISPVGCSLQSVLGEEGRDTGWEHARGERQAIREDLSSIREGQLRMLTPVVGRWKGQPAWPVQRNS